MKKQYEAPEAKFIQFQAEEMLMISGGSGWEIDDPQSATNGTLDLKFGD